MKNIAILVAAAGLFTLASCQQQQQQQQKQPEATQPVEPIKKHK